MKGITYKTPEGKFHKVIDFDEANKQAYIHISSGQYRWVTEVEYTTWERTDTGNVSDMPKIYIPDIPAQMIEQPKDGLEEVFIDYPDVLLKEEKPKRKRTKKEQA